MNGMIVAGALVVLLVGTELFFTVLSALNLRHKARVVDAERAWIVDELGIEDPDRAVAYERISTGLGTLRSWMLLVVVVLVLFSGLFVEATTAIARLDGLVLQTAVFFAGVVIAARLFGVPFDLVDTFVVEEAYGFNEQSLGLWVRDWIVGTALGVALVVPIGVAVVWIVDTVALWPVAAWLLVVGVILALQVLQPRVIMPLFYEFEPIADGELREGVEEVFERAGYRTEDVYEMNASSRSGHSNAFFSGFGPAKRVVLYDTLTDSLDTAAIKSVLAHELAHWREGHIWKFILLSTIRLGLTVAALAALVETGVVYAAVPAPETPYVGLFVGLLFLLPISRLTSPVENHFSLQYERDADAYAVEIVGGEPMARALAALSADNLSLPFAHPLYETFHYDHPPIPERIRRVRELDPDTESSTAQPSERSPTS